MAMVLADIDVGALLRFHRDHGRLATITAVQPPGRYGALLLGDRDRVDGFLEKPRGDGGWINGGFFVLSPEVLDRIAGDATVWEEEPLAGLARDGQLAAYKHEGFWQPMDTLRDRIQLDAMWASNSAPWRTWA
jgi:glucose-1-phosphate cytidylyltransferase